jgi:hypothetical protein
MRRFLGPVIALTLVSAPLPRTWADEPDAKAVIDRAIRAKGGEEKLKAAAFRWKSKGTLTINGSDNRITTATTIQGLDRCRREFEGDFNGQTFRAVTVLDGDAGWRRFADMTMELDADSLANEKRTTYLQLVPVILYPLKEQGFQSKVAGEETIGGKPASVLKVTGPDGKDFTLAFDKESGLPVRLVATVQGFMGEEFVQESTYADYKDFDGIREATRLESKRDGEPLVRLEVTEFKVLEKVDPEAFAEPK